MFKAQRRIEEDLMRAKSAVGLVDYQARSWKGWHRHQPLALIATWVVMQKSGQTIQAKALTIPQVSG